MVYIITICIFNGLFEENITAFFYLNRPGNFSSHARSCLELLIDVLTHLNDRSSLLFVTQQLKSKVDPSRFILHVPYMHLYIKVLIVVNFFLTIWKL